MEGVLRCRKELGYRVVCEQVSHHPPVSAFHAESPHFMLHGSIHPKLKFGPKSIEVTPKGVVTLHLFRYLLLALNSVLVAERGKHSGSTGAVPLVSSCP